MLKIGSYETAWHLCHRIRSAMDEVRGKLDGVIEIDETYIGGEKRGVGSGNYQRYMPLVVGAIERGGEVRLRMIPNRAATTLHGFVRSVTDDSVDAIYTDEWTGYRGIGFGFRGIGV
jgi:hypothetical protein